LGELPPVRGLGEFMVGLGVVLANLFFLFLLSGLVFAVLNILVALHTPIDTAGFIIGDVERGSPPQCRDVRRPGVAAHRPGIERACERK